MRERPVLFNGAMVRAILAGQKTQTRRVLKMPHGLWETSPNGLVPIPAGCPFGDTGDRLWVRETFLPDPECDHDAWDGHTDTFVSWSGCGSRLGGVPPALRNPKHCIYRAGWTGPDLVWRPSIHMPRWACRLVLEITAVRVERLQAISARDCQAEGITTRFTVDGGNDDLRIQFRDLWTSTGGDWDSNPWVWVIEFNRINEDSNG